MLDGLVSGLLVAWALTIFKVDKMFIEVIQPLTNVTITVSHYYLTVAIIGIIGSIFCKI